MAVSVSFFYRLSLYEGNQFRKLSIPVGTAELLYSGKDTGNLIEADKKLMGIIQFFTNGDGERAETICKSSSSAERRTVKLLLLQSHITCKSLEVQTVVNVIVMTKKYKIKKFKKF